MGQEISVIGAGSWGTALAHMLGSKGCAVRLWAHEEEIARGIRENRCNPVFLSGVELPATVTSTSSLPEAVERAGVILCVVPTQFIRATFRRVLSHVADGACVVTASKGIEKKTLLTPAGIFRELCGNDIRLGVLSGPSFAKEVAARKPTAVTLAVSDGSVSRKLQELFSASYFRVYTHHDLIGAELGGALKNVMAIAAGISDGMGLGHSARAALITRGLAEMIRFGVTVGADATTFSGLSGLGDLVLTCAGDLSRNRSVGVELGRGRSLKEILGEMRMVAEGVATARSAFDLAQKWKVEMPIVTEVYRVLYKRRSPVAAVNELMSRTPKSEFHGWTNSV